MLVVMGFLLVLATLTVAIAPRFQERQKVAKAADEMYQQTNNVAP